MSRVIPAARMGAFFDHAIEMPKAATMQVPLNGAWTDVTRKARSLRV